MTSPATFDAHANTDSHNPAESQAPADRPRPRHAGQAARVTGGAQGIAVRSAARGANHAPNRLKDDRNTKAVAREIEAVGRRCQVLAFGMTELAAANTALTRCWEKPGAIATPISAHRLDSPDLLKPLLANMPQNRPGKPADLAARAAFLASSDADYVTGTTWVVAGRLPWSYSEP